ncbi:MAG: CAP domain-containing protein [Gammaproteobacteria bacterium]|nr:CAP domain-containing protein [Gammaproteobacteria bacterium]
MFTSRLTIIRVWIKSTIVLLTLVGATASCSTTASRSNDLATKYNVKQEVLAAHNKWRKQHQAPNLVWDDQLANYAARYASRCEFKHSSSPYGENLATGYPSATIAVNFWYGEHAQYFYGRPGFSMRTGHFTQMIWKSTQKLGCAYVACNGRNGTPGKFLVCEYSPAGNVMGDRYFQENVLPSV